MWAEGRGVLNMQMQCLFIANADTRRTNQTQCTKCSLQQHLLSPEESTNQTRHVEEACLPSTKKTRHMLKNTHIASESQSQAHLRHSPAEWANQGCSPSVSMESRPCRPCYYQGSQNPHSDVLHPSRIFLTPSKKNCEDACHF